MSLLGEVIQERPFNSHKGDFGRVLLIGGTYPYGGAILMAAQAALYSGAGLVTVATDRENILPLHARIPEAMAIDLEDQPSLIQELQKARTVVIGPGLSTNDLGMTLLGLVCQQIQKEQILILDGGAIRLIAQGSIPFPDCRLIFTPHQKELEDLLGLEVEQQSKEKVQTAIERLPLGAILVEKRPHTRIWEKGRSDHYQLQVGGPHQATGGMGDTLAGMIAGFTAQFKQVSLYQCVTAATYVHSAIADGLKKEAYVVLPSQLTRQIPSFMRRVCEGEDFSDPLRIK
ncbi:NAD(P)H-hydrate dehydratase [Streptococcus sp. DD13]|uniref:NAD(P)H-hydrate dehydratase n=1 Tax=Streptococcus sp. DD13 TaxID=1777881 RepID=UPI0007938612|nr:NAD(P)H-hydrate dehydratase [Streptococcus sp. DD13]KXT79245.1 NAD(P)HX dehydratase [Streptococcus sp. DD13]